MDLDTLGRIYRADSDDLAGLLVAIPEHTRGDLAAFFYRRSHTHELGLKVAATCCEITLKRAAGHLGEDIFARSRQHFTRVRHGEVRLNPPKKISLGGSRSMPVMHA